MHVPQILILKVVIDVKLGAVFPNILQNVLTCAAPLSCENIYVQLFVVRDSQGIYRVQQ